MHAHDIAKAGKGVSACLDVDIGGSVQRDRLEHEDRFVKCSNACERNDCARFPS
jgi:hypothetical protein